MLFNQKKKKKKKSKIVLKNKHVYLRKRKTIHHLNKQDFIFQITTLIFVKK